ncbi:hypothetical protein [Pontibacillus litoralis]|uniref:Uncharacterized protein n=1 Tax=Pontibacillus litoralis JSM 072002 TaxID=1385512 RepID=A0A0A5HPM6_9BACI|nr:hypothetical protein [Pontibacillus litoralis]KGX85557.1 hypothetical protein N784_08595 [Pontibacillus litoralis JSM 072002]
MKKIVRNSFIGVLIVVGLIFYFDGKHVHTKQLQGVEIQEKHENQHNGKVQYTIVAGNEELIVDHQATWDLIEEGEVYNIEYEYAKSIDPTVLSIVDESQSLKGSGH